MERFLKNRNITAKTIAVIVLAVTAVGCDASARDYCRKLVNECEYAEPNYGIDQCEAETQVYIDDLEEGPDADYDTEAWQDYMNCVSSAECGAIFDSSDPAYPACYDPRATVY